MGGKEVDKGMPKPEKSGEGININKYIIILSIILIILGVIIIILFLNDSQDEEDILTCGDNTLYGSCSPRQPYYCDDGKLIKKSSLCGCPDGLDKSKGDSCISEYHFSPKNVQLKYILRGEENTISFIVYKGMNDYVSELPKSIEYSGDETPSRADFKLRNINEENQRELLLPLVTEIQNLAPNSKEDQVRIAISLIQKIPFGVSNKTTEFFSSVVNYSRYPYEVLYDYEGVCGEKSELLAFLLKEMNYGVAFFYHQQENHESLGIKCPTKYSLAKSGYCFIETTGPSIITDNEIKYVGNTKLNSEPEVILISDGKSLKNDLYEYEDSIEWKEIRERIERGELFNVLDSSKKEELEIKYGLVDEYYSG